MSFESFSKLYICFTKSTNSNVCEFPSLIDIDQDFFAYYDAVQPIKMHFEYFTNSFIAQKESTQHNFLSYNILNIKNNEF